MNRQSRRADISSRRPLQKTDAARDRPRLQPGPGPWSLSYLYVDRQAGPFSWPSEGSRDEADVILTLSRINELVSLSDALNATHGVSLRPRMKLVDYESLTPAASERFAQLREGLEPGDLRLVGDELLEVTYCHRFKHPARIWAYEQVSENRIFPLWWDPHHLVCGYDPRQQGSGRTDLCPVACLHPPWPEDDR